MILIWRTDVHVTSTPPESRTDDWESACIDKLKQVNEVARETKAVAILDGGDLLHRKSPMANSHSLVQRLCDVHNDAPCITAGNVGNHDVKYGDIRFLDESPLGTLFASGNLKRLYDQHELFLEENGVTVRVVGVPYHGVKYDMTRFSQIRKGKEDFLICIAHVLASAEGGSMFEGEDIIAYHDLDAFEPDVFCFGHWHKNQGITRTSKGKLIVNTGSLSRGSLSQDDLTRIPVCVKIEVDKEGVRATEIPIKVKPANEVFDLIAKNIEGRRESAMEGFQIQLALAERPKGWSERLGKLNVSSEVKERCLSYLERP